MMLSFLIIQGILNIGALIGAAFTGVALDKFGRKAMLIAGCLPCILGWYVISASFFFITKDNYIPVFVMLLVGRFLTGLSAGFFSLTVPVSLFVILTSVTLCHQVCYFWLDYSCLLSFQ